MSPDILPYKALNDFDFYAKANLTKKVRKSVILYILNLIVMIIVGFEQFSYFKSIKPRFSFSNSTAMV